MSYTKTNWHDGDTITAVKMNKIENGIESSLSDVLITLGKALCGDSFEVKPGLTDAETILEIAKNYTGGSGSGGSAARLIDTTVLEPVAGETNTWQYETGLGVRDFAGASICILPDSEVVTTFLFQIVTVFDTPGGIMIVAINGTSGTLTGTAFAYDPETGYIRSNS